MRSAAAELLIHHAILAAARRARSEAIRARDPRMRKSSVAHPPQVLEQPETQTHSSWANATASNDLAVHLDCQQAAQRGLFWSWRLSRFPGYQSWDSIASGSWRERPTRPLCLRWPMTRTVRASIIGAVASSSQLFFSPKASRWSTRATGSVSHSERSIR